VKLLRHNERGQMLETAFTAISLVIGLSVGAIVLANIFPATETAATVTVVVPYTTLNSAMSDNTYGVPTHWENVVSDNRVAIMDNANGKSVGAGLHFLQDNDNGGCYWYQTLSVSINDGVVSAPVSFRYQLSDNSGLAGALATHVIRVKLGRPGGDNITVWENLSRIVADNATWYTQENDMASYITASGAYTLYLYDNAVTVGDATKDNVSVRWDDASLIVNTENITSKAALNTLYGIESLGWTGIGLLAVAIIVLAAVVIVGYVRLMGGKHAV